MPKAKKRRCGCAVCSCRDRNLLVDAYRTVIAGSYTREEFLLVTRASKAAMLPRDTA